MMWESLFLLLPLAALSGWWIGRKNVARDCSGEREISQHYIQGLNYILNEQPDKALDVFVQLLQVDSETVETHLALGQLFRRRGETHRAIRIHQNLIARPQLKKEHKQMAMRALGLDYMAAGLFDRAESIFLELMKVADYRNESLQELITIYQQMRDWQNAIQMAERLQGASGAKIKPLLAQFYCEIADSALQSAHYSHARQQLKHALNADSKCCRASILMARIELSQKQYRKAIKWYYQVEQQDPSLFGEVLEDLGTCYKALDDEEEFINYLMNVVDKHQNSGATLNVVGKLTEIHGHQVGAAYIKEKLKVNPDLSGIAKLIELQLKTAEGDAKEVLQTLNDLVSTLVQHHYDYHCKGCGFSSNTFYWQCPTCKTWAQIKPSIQLPTYVNS